MKAWVGLFFVLCIAFGGCSPQMLEEDLPKPSDSTEIVTPPIVGDTTYYSIAQAQQYYKQNIKEIIWVRGYIVGCVSGTNLNGAQFVPPFSSETNLLLADKPNETNTSRCLPVALPPRTDYRTNLNLVSHFELLGKRIALYGYLEKYFLQAGMKVFHEYFIFPSSDYDDEDPNPDTDIDTKPDTITSIPISNSGEVIHGGRVIRK